MQYKKQNLLKRNKHNISQHINKVEISFGIDRVNVFRVFIIFIFTIIIGRLFYIQIVKYDDYKEQASIYQDVIEKVPANRGEIFVTSNKEVDLKSMKTYNISNIDNLDEIAININKYNVIFNPKMLFNYSKLTDNLISNVFGKTVIVDRLEIESMMASLNNSEESAEKLLEILYPDLYKLKDKEAQIKALSDQKTELEAKIKVTKNSKTKKTLENQLAGVKNALKLDEETQKGLDSLKIERASILSKITKENDAYEIIKRDVSEENMNSIISYFQGLYYDKFYNFIKPLKSTLKELQLRNFYKYFLTFEKNESRLYPDSNIFSQITGFLKTEEKEEKAIDGTTIYHKYGKGVYGIEGYFDEELRGEDGEIRGKFDGNNQLIATANRSEKPAKDGDGLVLTIDKSIQYEACQELNEAVKLYEAEGGSVLIMNPQTGEILAMCNNPTYDANVYNQVADIAVYNNPIISDQVEFGSVMKVITMASGIDLGVVGAYSTYEDTGCTKVGDWPKPICNSDNSTKGAHGKTDMIDVLNKSLNLGAWHVANKIGKTDFIKYVDNFGFGQKTGIELGSEAKGDMRNLDKIVNKNGDIYLATASYGQGITMTQIQYLTAFSSVINGGKLMKPYIIKATINQDGNIKVNEPQFIRNTISESTSSIMRGMLVSVVERGYDKSSQVTGYYVGGKTGTAQFAENGVYGDKTTQSFVGFGPVDDPKFAVMVKLQNPKTEFASYSCTPVFVKIAKYLFNYYQIPPDKKD